MCTPPPAWPMGFWGFLWEMMSLGYAFEHMAWPYQMLLTDIATMELPAKGSQVMTRAEDEDELELTQWIQTSTKVPHYGA